MGELWKLLDSAQNNDSGIPQEMIDKKKEEIKNRRVSPGYLKNFTIGLYELGYNLEISIYICPKLFIMFYRKQKTELAESMKV